jgi:tyrosine-protein kinase Etk/Wzc
MDNKALEYAEMQMEQSIDFKALLFKFLKYWYLFVITITLALFIAYLYNKYTQPVYMVKSTVLIAEDKNAFNGAQSLLGYTNFTNTQKLQNQIGILRSRSLVSRTLKSLSFDVSIFKEGNFITSEVYTTAPFEVIIDTANLQPIGNARFFITILSETYYRVEASGENLGSYDYKSYTYGKKYIPSIKYDVAHRFGEPVLNENFSFRIEKKPGIDFKSLQNQRFYFTFNTLDALISQFSGYDISSISPESSILQVTLNGNNPEKSADFLNQLSREYIRQGLEKKNLIAINTIMFIDGQLKEMRDSLRINENVLQNFRTNNQVMNMDAKIQDNFNNISELDKEKAQLLIKSKYYKNLKEYIETNKDNINGIVVPSAIGIDDPFMTDLITRLFDLMTERAERLVTTKANNPMVLSLNRKIENLKQSMYESATNIVKSSDIAISDIDARIAKYSASFSALPGTERNLLGIERMYKLNDAIYTYLLQKRSEAGITQASNTSDNEVVDAADAVVQEQVLPRTNYNYTISFLIGFILPLLFVLGRDYFNDKVTNKSDIEKVTQLPIIGQILHNRHDSKIVAFTSPKSAVSESFRALRTNLRNLTKDKEKFVILLTSTGVNEGKTFCALNLACIYAQFERKTLLMGYDLRKPKIYQDLGLTNTVGITTYLTGKSSMDDIIQRSSVPNLDFISAGPVPPNPAELIASPQNTFLLRQLKEMYDYVILDTPPVAIVTDAFLLIPNTDANILLVREDTTNKKVLGVIAGDFEKRNILNSVILVNDVKKDNIIGKYGYGYGYGYGQGYGYYSDDTRAETQKASLFKRIFRRT